MAVEARGAAAGRAATAGCVATRATSSEVWDQSCFLPREELDRRHLHRLQTLLVYCYDHVPFYRRLYDQASFKPSDIASLADFQRKVPRVDKPDLMTDQRRYGAALANDLPRRFGAYFHQTSGTTGEPLEEWSSAYDMLSVGDSWCTTWWAMGLRPGDGIYFCFNFGPYAGFWTAFYAAQRMGLTVLSGSTLSSRQRLAELDHLRPAAVVATPTYCLRLIEEAQAAGFDPAGLGLRYAIVAGEPTSAAVRRRVTEAFALEYYADQYGISDMMWGTSECPTSSGGIHVFEPAYYSYSVDPDTGYPVEEDGQVGENMVTAYNRCLQPVVNYHTHDLVRRYRSHDHGCDWTWEWLDGVVLGRTDQMLTIRGTNVYPSAVETLLCGVNGLSAFYELHIGTERGMDSLTVKVETTEPLPADRLTPFAEAVRDQLRAALAVDVGVELRPPGDLPRAELKTKRVFDHRHETPAPADAPGRAGDAR